MKLRRLDQVDFTFILIIIAVIFQILFVDLSHYYLFFTLSFILLLLNRIQKKHFINNYFIMGIILFFQVVIIKYPYFLFSPEIIGEQGTNFLYNFIEMSFLSNLFLRDFTYIPIIQRLSSIFLLTTFGVRNFNISASLFSLVFTAVSFSCINLSIFRSVESNDKLRFFYSTVLSVSILPNSATLVFVNFIYAASIPLIILPIANLEKLPKIKLVILTIFFSLVVFSKSVFASLLPLYIWVLYKSIRIKEKNKIIFSSSLIVSMILLIIVSLTLAQTVDDLILGQNLDTTLTNYNQLNRLEELLIGMINRFLPFIEDALDYKSRSNFTHTTLFYFIGLVKMGITFIQSFSVFLYFDGISSIHIYSIMIGLVILLFITLYLIGWRKSIDFYFIELFFVLTMVISSNIFITWLAYDFSILVTFRSHYVAILTSILIQLFFMRILFEKFKSIFRIKAIGYFLPIIIVAFLILNSMYSIDYEQRSSNYSKWSYFNEKVFDSDYVIPINPDGWFITKNNPHKLIIDNNHYYYEFNKINARMIIIHCEYSCSDYNSLLYIDSFEKLHNTDVLVFDDRIYLYFKEERFRMDLIDFSDFYPLRIQIFGEITN